MKQVIVTRPSPDGERTCKALAIEGIETIHAPVMTVRPVEQDDPPALAFTHLAFTSANGVRAYGAQAWRQVRPVFCVGEATASEAKNMGLPIAGVAQGAVADLARLIVETTGSKLHELTVLHGRGEQVAGQLVDTLQEAGIAAQAVTLYRAEMREELPAEALEALGAGEANVAFFSPRSARLFGKLLRQRSPAPNLSQTYAFCLSEAVAEAARACGFGHVLDAAQATEAALVDMIASQGT